MWFALSILALLMLSSRRTAEKRASDNIDSMAMSWLQQGVALPLIVVTLLLSKFYWPSELPMHFWVLMVYYIVLQTVFLYCYFRAIAIADISYVAPIFTTFVVGNLIGAYFILGQIPSLSGMIGALFIMAGVFIIAHAKYKHQQMAKKSNKQAFVLVMIAVVVSSIFSSIEVLMLRMSNPTSYNFYTSLITVPFVIVVSMVILKGKRQNIREYWYKVGKGARTHIWPLIIIGVTYTINMLATYQAKVIAPNQAYVGTIKAASVLPVVVMGVLIFNEKVNRTQWIGIGSMLIGLAIMALNI